MEASQRKNAAKTSRVYSKLKGTVPEVIDASGTF